MIGALVVVGIIFYAVLYSGIRTLQHPEDPISTLQALDPRVPKPGRSKP